MKMYEFINYCKDKFDDLQITRKTSKTQTFTVVDDKVKDVNIAEETNYEVVANINDKYININTNYLSTEVVENIFEKAANIQSNYKEKFLENTSKISYFKKENLNFDINEEIDKIVNLNNLKKNNKFIVSIENNFEYTYIEKEILNMKGVSLISSNNEYCYYCEVTARKNENTVSLDDVIYKTTNDINYDQICKSLIEKTKKLLNCTKIESKEYNVIFSSTISSKLIKNIINLVSKEEIRKKSSCFENKLNQKIASDCVNIKEEPLNENYPAFTGFDDEGTATIEKYIIKNGILKNYLYNNREAIIDKVESTGNGYQGISARNVVLEPGLMEESDLIDKITDGLYIIDFQETGGTVLNNTNGEINAQIFGYKIENGKITNGIEQCILSTNIFEILKNIKYIGNNLEFKTFTTGSPSLFIEKMSIVSN